MGSLVAIARTPATDIIEHEVLPFLNVKDGTALSEAVLGPKPRQPPAAAGGSNVRCVTPDMENTIGNGFDWDDWDPFLGMFNDIHTDPVLMGLGSPRRSHNLTRNISRLHEHRHGTFLWHDHHRPCSTM